MLYNIETAQRSLRTTALSMPLGIVILTAMGVFVLTNLSTPIKLWLCLIAGIMFLPVSFYIQYRSKFDVTYMYWGNFFIVIATELIPTSCVVVILFEHMSIASSLLKWLTVLIACLIISMSLLMAANKIVKPLDLKKNDPANPYKGKWPVYVDINNYIIHAKIPETELDRKINHYKWVIMGILMSIPSLFRAWTNDVNDAVFIAVPLAVLLYSYVNFYHLGPSLGRLYVLRHVEKVTGRRFVNSDYEQIQELRRSFWLSRWLMKDYLPVRK
ncbi:hypothetical protein HZU77_003470 [Neisseriaceae bacterium TC5R-5]|nr:hypothetical protein [Neisseriaceae bacterium TC5R-5]